MLPALSRLTLLGPSGRFGRLVPLSPLGPPEQTGTPAKFVTDALAKVKGDGRNAVASRQAAKRKEANDSRRFPHLYGTRTYPAVLKSTEEDHLEIAAVLCYTKGDWDKLLNYRMSNQGMYGTTATKAFMKIVQSPAMLTLRAAHWAMYAMFMDDAEFIQYLTGEKARSPLQLSVDPVNYCALGHEYRGPSFKNLRMKASSIPLLYIQRPGFGVESREVVAEQTILNGIEELLPKLLEMHSTDDAAARLFNKAVENMTTTLSRLFVPISTYKVGPCTFETEGSRIQSGKYVFYKGITIEKETNQTDQEAASVDPRCFVSASRDVNEAMKFVKREVASCCLNVFLLDPGCPVIDVNAFMGKKMSCYDYECEVILQNGLIYDKMPGNTQQVLADNSIAKLIATEEYRIPDSVLETLKENGATWWLVKPRHEEKESDGTSDETDVQTEVE